MADELYTQAVIRYSKNNVEFDRSQSTNISPSGDHAIFNVQDIGITPENLEMGDVVIPGYFFGKNLDSTNSVTLGINDGSYRGAIALRPSETCLFRCSGSGTLQAQAIRFRNQTRILVN